MPNSKKYLKKLKTYDFGKHLAYVESFVFEVEAIRICRDQKIRSLKRKRLKHWAILVMLLISMVLLPLFIMYLLSHTANALGFEFVIYAAWAFSGLYLAYRYYNSFREKKLAISQAIQKQNDAVKVALSFADKTNRAYFDLHAEEIDMQHIDLGGTSVEEVNEILNENAIDLSIFERIAYNNDDQRSQQFNATKAEALIFDRTAAFMEQYLLAATKN